MPASVTVEGGGFGLLLGSLPYGGQPGMSLFICYLRLCLIARFVSPM